MDKGIAQPEEEGRGEKVNSREAQIAGDEENFVNALSAIDPETTAVELFHMRCRNIIGLDRFTQLQQLSLNQNLVTKIENLSQLIHLVDLDLSDNQIEVIEGLDTLLNLKKLDISYNRLHKIGNISHLVKLEKLYLVNNKIPKIEGLESLVNLELLELGDNNIRVIENLTTLTKLKELYLGKNKITKVQGLETLSRLELLSMPANRVKKIEGLESQVSLKEFYISENGIENIDGLQTQAETLEILDISVCRINTLNSIEIFTNLTDLWANDNRIDSFAEVDKLVNLKNLRTVYLEHNPVSKSADYRRKIILDLPQITQIDAIPCREEPIATG